MIKDLRAWADQAPLPPVPRDPIAFDLWEAKRFGPPIPPIARKNRWRTSDQRRCFIENHAALDPDAWSEVVANDESAMWRLVLAGDTTLFLEISAMRSGANRAKAAR